MLLRKVHEVKPQPGLTLAESTSSLLNVTLKPATSPALHPPLSMHAAMSP